MPDRGRERTEDIARRLLRNEFARLVGPARADARAQEGGGGFGIQNIRRGVMFEELDASSAITIPHATAGFAGLSTPLRGDIYLSGRPLLVAVAATVNAGASGDLKLSVLLRGQEVTGRANGIPGTYTATTAIIGISGWWVVSTPASGRASVELAADAATADATLYADAASNLATLLAVEL